MKYERLINEERIILIDGKKYEGEILDANTDNQLSEAIDSFEDGDNLVEDGHEVYRFGKFEIKRKCSINIEEKGRKMKYNNINGMELGQFNEIMKELGYCDNEVYYMEDLDEIFAGNVREAIREVFYGSQYGFTKDQFNLNDSYFVFDGYGNLESIPEYYLQDYFDLYKNEILEYINDNEFELYGVEEMDEDDQ